MVRIITKRLADACSTANVEIDTLCERIGREYLFESLDGWLSSPSFLVGNDIAESLAIELKASIQYLCELTMEDEIAAAEYIEWRKSTNQAFYLMRASYNVNDPETIIQNYRNELN